MNKLALALALVVSILFTGSYFYLGHKIANRPVAHQIKLSETLCLDVPPACLIKKHETAITLYCHSGGNFHIKRDEDLKLTNQKAIFSKDHISLFEFDNQALLYQLGENQLSIAHKEVSREELEYFKSPKNCNQRLESFDFFKSSGQYQANME